MGEEYDEDTLRRFAIRAKANQQVILAFLLILMAIGLFLVLAHQVKEHSHRAARRRRRRGEVVSSSSWLKSLPRHARRRLLRQSVGLPSMGHSGLVIVYLALNLVGLLAKLDNKNMDLITNIASRAAWLAIANLLVVVLLALKNTPLAFLTPWSYERLNCLHRISGSVAVAHVAIHAASYTTYFVRSRKTEIFSRPSDICGIVAGVCWVLMALAAVVIRPRWYELFYYVHVGLWTVSLVMIGLHQPELANKIALGTVAAGVVWSLDRAVRGVRLLANAANNTAVLTPLPHGVTRVVLSKPPAGAVPGKHCFLWIPAVRKFETHPFTMVSTDPLEFVVASHTGFTRDLHRRAMASPGVPFRAAAEGPYGTVPDPGHFETVVLVAGGNGASFTFGLAQQLLAAKATKAVTKRVVFIWAMRSDSYVKWFASHLTNLTRDPRFLLRVFVTRSSPDAASGVKQVTAQDYASYDDDDVKSHSLVESSSLDLDLEKSSSPPTHSHKGSLSIYAKGRCVDSNGLKIHHVRPDVAKLIREAVSLTAPDERLLVAGCGGAGLVRSVRQTAADCITSNGPSVELHCEQFG